MMFIQIFGFQLIQTGGCCNKEIMPGHRAHGVQDSNTISGLIVRRNAFTVGGKYFRLLMIMP